MINKLLIFFILFCNHLLADNLIDFKESCELIGFKKGTKDFGNCVLNLKRKSEPTTYSGTNQTITKTQQNLKGDDSEGDKICQKYGFKVGNSDYKECRMNLDIAKQQAESQQRAYDEQVRQYNQQKAEYEARVEQAKKDKQSKDMFNLLMYGLNRYGGKTHDEAAPALYGLPAYPKQPRAPIMPMPIQPIGGRTMDCHWDVWRKVYRCQ